MQGDYGEPNLPKLLAVKSIRRGGVRIVFTPHGKYRIQVKYYSQNGNRTSSASQATIEVIENYGRKNETSFRKTVSLSGRELIDVVTVAVGK